MSSALLDRESEVKRAEPGEPVVAHIVNCPDEYERAADYLMDATVLGFEVTALCGHVFIPTRDHKGKPVCVPCLDAASQIISEESGF